MNEILIYEDIGEGFFDEGITAKSIKAQLDKFNGGDVLVRINSAGGDVFDGLAIYNLLNEYPGEVSIKVDALAASAASVIAMAGDNREMADNALLMIHDPWTMAVGDSAEMRKMADILDKAKDSIVTTYMSRVSEDEEAVRNMMAEETWLNASEAMAMGFATSTIEGGEPPAVLNKAWIRSEPPREKIAASGDRWRVAINRRRLALIDRPDGRRLDDRTTNPIQS